MSNYSHTEIEKRWKDQWYRTNLYKAVDFSEKPKKYIMAEFPYPSGKSLHAGHMMRYTLPDIYARYLRMKGYNVLFPFGYDAFGLPAENYAVQTGEHPSKLIDETIEHYRDSVLSMGYGIDWDREIKTTDPKYYKWTQWIFLKFFKENMAEYKKAPIWWCPALKTVLSDEEVLTGKDGNKISERGSHPVEKRMLSQWVLKITKYADKLIEGLDLIDFPESIKTAQKNWIGRSHGALIDFNVNGEKVTVFTTRPDTVYGITFLVIAPENPIISKFLDKVSNKEEIEEYIKISKNKSDLERQASKEKTGVLLKGVSASCPFEDDLKDIPVFLADYVLMDYGTGAVMGVPAHDERDFEFAQKYGLKVIKVIENPENPDEEFYTGEGIMLNSGKYTDMKSEDFRKKVVEDMEKEGYGKEETTYRMRDWVFSRQRYWGEPIPVVHTEDGEILPICDPDNKEDVKNILPLTLPEVPDYNPTEDGSSPLENNKEWVNTEFNGKKVKRETNTMPNWAGSCWYYLRYLDPTNDETFADMEKMKYWLPVDRYFGGAEHITLHLLYSRFWHKFLYDLGLVPTPEPYQWRLTGGLLLGEDGKKMSKSLGNIIVPAEIIEKYGADALRLNICFLGPYEGVYPWNSNSIKAMYKLIDTIYGFSDKLTAEPASEHLLKLYNKMTKNVTEMAEELKMNTCVSEFMIFVNEVKNMEKINVDVYKGFIRLLAPFAPFVSEEIWQKVNNYSEWTEENSVHKQEWATYDEKYLEEISVKIPVQINGKVRSTVEIGIDDDEETVKSKVLADEKIKNYTKDSEIRKFIYITGKIVNIVL